MVNYWFHRALQLALSPFLLLPYPSTGQAINCLGTSAADSPAAREELDRGQEAYNGARYAEAIRHFEKATALAPCLTMARQHLATAQAQMVVPGLTTPDNLTIAGQAIANFQIVLAQDPHNLNSLKQIADIYFAIKKFEEARDLQKKVLVEDPHDYEASYTIGVIDWTLAHQNVLQALRVVGLVDDGEGNTQAPPEVLASIKRQNTDLVAEAVQYLTRAVADHPNYDNAMAYLNLIYRRKADIDFDNPDLRAEDVAAAKQWGRKSMLTRSKNEEDKLAQPQ